MRLDIRALARAGALKPGLQSELRWTQRDKIFAAIMLHAESDLISLNYRITNPRDAYVWSVQELIPLTFTACRYGGTRPWFRCVGCNQRRAVLYGTGAGFRCAPCQHLAYSSTRDPKAERLIRRVAVLRRTLNGAPDDSSLPGKPKGMHWRT